MPIIEIIIILQYSVLQFTVAIIYNYQSFAICYLLTTYIELFQDYCDIPIYGIAIVAIFGKI